MLDDERPGRCLSSLGGRWPPEAARWAAPQKRPNIGRIVRGAQHDAPGSCWCHELRPELKAEGWSPCTIEIEPVDEVVKLTVTHTIARECSQFIGAVFGGWPQRLSNPK